MRSALDEAEIELLQRWLGLALIGVNVSQKVRYPHRHRRRREGEVASRVLKRRYRWSQQRGHAPPHLLCERFEIGRLLGRTLMYGADVEGKLPEHRRRVRHQGTHGWRPHGGGDQGQ